jgi:hypothetical protein
VIFQTRYDGEDWEPGWGAVTSQEKFLEKEDGRESDFRMICTAAPAPVEYAMTYVRYEQMVGTFPGLIRDMERGKATFVDVIQIMIEGDLRQFDP